MNVSVGIVLFPNVTQLDVTGPYEVFARMPATRVHVVAASLEPIRGERGLTLLPDLTCHWSCFRSLAPIQSIRGWWSIETASPAAV